MKIDLEKLKKINVFQKKNYLWIIDDVLVETDSVHINYMLFNKGIGIKKTYVLSDPKELKKFKEFVVAVKPDVSKNFNMEYLSSMLCGKKFKADIDYYKDHPYIKNIERVI